MADKTEWMNKLSNVIQPSKGGQTKGASSEGGPPTMRQSLSDGSLVSYLGPVWFLFWKTVLENIF